jgi:LysM repeat protein
MKRLACAFVLAGSALLVIGSPLELRADPSKNQGSLQLSILTPDSGSIVDRMSLDVSFKGNTVERVELYLDGNLVAQRQLSTAQSRGVISFSLDTMQLTEGSHDVQVKAFGPDGKPVIANTRIKIPALDLTAPVRISYPQNGLLVNGVVPIRVTLESELQKQKPYVTFFVDKELKVLRNYPPYEYNWDTTKIQNGWHVVEAWTQAADTASPLKARPVHVNVNNASGETKRMSEIPDLRNEKPAKSAAQSLDFNLSAKGKGVDPSTAVTGAASPIPGVVTRGDNRLHSGAPSRNSVGPLRSTEPSLYGYGKTSAAPGYVPGVGSPRSAKVGPAARMMGGAVQEPKGGLLVNGGAKPVLPAVSDGSGAFRVVSPSGDATGSLVKIQPGESLESVSKRTGVSAQNIARLNGLQSKRLPAVGSIIVPHVGAFDVAFDGNRIVFDVQPRVEGGVKLAPFRQIFEHTGGRLYWFGGQAQTVRAVNNSREIEIKIGQKNALVNNQVVSMEKKPYILGGRTIVPLTFIRDSMSVKISFDEKSGRLLIESVK